MSIYFCNESTIDLDVIRIMGVSVKENDSPIGYFGTGLKFAVATLLRTGHKITILRDGIPHEMGTAAKTIRGERFSVVTMDGQELAFMTQLGRDWKPWMAYRELHSNCLDEGGVISDRLPEGRWGTVIRVDGDGIREAYHNRRSIFLDTKPLFAGSSCEIHEGDSPVGFFRGIQAIKLKQQPMFTYNVTHGVSLTEDRTISDAWSYGWEVARAIASCDRDDVLETILLDSRDDSYEASLDLVRTGTKPSEVFMRVCEPYAGGFKLLPNARKLYEKHARGKVVPDLIVPDALSEAEIGKALSLLRRVDCDLPRDGFKIVESLGGPAGMVREGQIMIEKLTLDRGYRFIASTLYEEWLHKSQGLKDESRELQNLLLDRLFHFVDLAALYESS